MNWKKFFIAAICAISVQTTAFAHGELWYDATSRFAQLKDRGKIIVYPLEYEGKFLVKKNENHEFYKANDYFNKRFVRKLKVQTVAVGISLDKENKKILDEEKYKILEDSLSYPLEKKGETIKVLGWDGFIIPRVNIVNTEPHLSPAKTVTIQMKSWTKEVDGPNGDRTYNERTWNENFTIPAENLMLYHFGLEYDMYDKESKKIMTYRNAEHTYGENYGGIIGAINGIFGGKQTHSLNSESYRLELFKSVVDEFRKDFEDTQKDFKKNKKKNKSRISEIIGFKQINLPAKVGSDEYSLKSCYFAMKDLALKHTNLKIDYDGTGNAQFFVEGTINYYSLDRRWIEPSVTMYDELISEEESDWIDSKGEKHTKKIQQYRTKPSGKHGYYEYFATVRGTFNLVDSSGRIILTHSATEFDDKVADAYRHLLKNFYSKVNSYFGIK